MTVQNNGSNSARGVVLTDVISNGEVTGITPSQGTCSKAAVSVCRLKMLATGDSATVAVEIKAKADPLQQQLRVSGAPTDNVPDNSTMNLSTEITP